MLSLGVDAGAINTADHSLLHKAAIYGRRDVCEFLLEGPGGQRYKSGGGWTKAKESELPREEPRTEKEPGEEKKPDSAKQRAERFNSRCDDDRVRIPPAFVGFPLGRKHTRPDLRNQQPSDMAR